MIDCKVWDHVYGGGKYYRMYRVFGRGRSVNVQKIQFAGLVGDPPRPVLTFGRPKDIDTVLAIDLLKTTIAGERVKWLDAVKAYRLGTGMKYYIPGSLIPFIGEPPKYAYLCMVQTCIGAVGLPSLVLDTEGKYPLSWKKSPPSKL